MTPTPAFYYDSLFETAPIGIITATMDGSIHSCNRLAVELLGEECCEGSSISDLDRSGKIREAIERVVAGETLVTARFDRDGRVLDLRAVCCVGPDRRPAVLMMVEDVSASVAAVQAREEAIRARDELLSRERKARQQIRQTALALQRSERSLRIALEAGRMGTWEWDALSNEVHWSDTLHSIYGILPGTFGGTYEAFLAYVHPEDRAHVEAKVAEAGATCRDYEIEFRIIRPDGSVRWIADRAQALVNEAGERIGIVGVCWDNTEPHAALEDRDRLTAELRRTHALLDSLFENAPIGFGFWDCNARYQRVNRALAEINGVPPEAHVGKTVEDIVKVDSSVTETLRRVIATGETVNNQEASGETPARPGEIRYWSVGYYPVRVGDEIVGAGAICEEITERKQVEQQFVAALEREQQARSEAEAAEQRADFLAESATVLASSLDYRETLTSVGRLAVPRIADWTAIDIVDPDGTTRRVYTNHRNAELNPLVFELLGGPPAPGGPLSRVLATGVGELISDIPDTQEGCLPHLRTLGLKSYVVVPIRARGRVAGAISLAVTEARPRYGMPDLRLAQELADRAAVAIENATLYAQAAEKQKEAEQAAERLQKANTELEQFAYVASHDLQEPLRTVGSYAQLLARRYTGRLDGDADEFVGRVVEGVKRMRSLIENLLEYSRVVREDEQPEGIVDMNDALGTAIESLSASVDESGARIDHSVLPVLEPADRTQMVQLLQNLIGNSIKYRKPDRAPVVTISAEREDQLWHFQVQDNGEGFDQHFADRIFGAFKRLHGQEVPGTGIGLAVCKRIVERHGGRIWAESRAGEGAKFHFTIRSLKQ